MLARIQKAMKEKDEGFTLIELLVVIIIIGILAAIAIPVFLNQRKKASESSIKSDLRTVANEMETYYTDSQTYPATVATVDGVAGVGDVDVQLSAENTVVTDGTQPDGGYCLAGTSTQTDAEWYYNSTTGGLTKTAC